MEERCPNPDLRSPKNGPVEIFVLLGTNGISKTDRSLCGPVDAVAIGRHRDMTLTTEAVTAPQGLG